MEQNTFNKKVNYNQPYKAFKKVSAFGLPILKAKKKLQSIKQKQTDSPEKILCDKQRSIKFEIKCESIELKNRLSPTKLKNKFSMSNFRNQNHSMENINHTSITLIKHMVSLHEPKIQQITANPQENYVPKTFQLIPNKSIMLNKQQNLKKQGEIIAFYPLLQQYVALYPVLSQVSYPSQISNSIPCFGIYQKENTDLKYYVAQMHEQQCLKNIIKQFGCLKQNVAQRIVRQVVLTILRLHQCGFPHNRIKLNSIYLVQQGIFINMFRSSSKPLTEKQKNLYIHYFPPEMLLSRDNYNSKKNDIWAIGCLTLQILSSIPLENNKYHPYNRVIQSQILNQSSVLVEQIKSKYRLQPKNIKQIGLSAKSVDFILKCMRVKMQNRPSIDELLEHPFLKQ